MDTDSFSLSGLRSKVIEWLGGCERLEALKRNGRNNRVFEVESAGRRYFCKQYYRGEGEKVSARQDAEWRFAKLANRTAPGKSPKALFRDEVLAVTLFEYIDGESLSLPVVEADVLDAFQFLSRINEETRVAGEFPLASDSCFSLEQHLSHVERRFIAFESMEDVRLARFIKKGLMPVYQAVCESIPRLGLDVRKVLVEEELLLSPSDFGFHNALRRPNGEIVYLDFEYAGRDDPMKCMCDFFAQPDFPVPLDSLDKALDLLPAKCGRQIGKLITHLLPLYVVKWSCIILNPFHRGSRERRQFSGGEGGELEDVLLAAKRYFEQHAARRLESWPT